MKKKKEENINQAKNTKSKKKEYQPKKKRKNIFYYLVPNHFMGEITGWGFHFSWKDTLISFGLYSSVGIICGLVFGLDWKFLILMVLIELLFVPSLIINNFQRMYEQSKFDDVNDYIEQVLYSFSQTKKIVSALEETKTVFSDNSPMGVVIDKALDMIMTGANYNPRVQEDALAMIEAEYPVERLHTVHQFLLKIEKRGGNFNKTLNLLLEDRASWEERIAKSLNIRKHKKTTTVVSIMFAMIICAAFTRLIVLAMDNTIDISAILQNFASQVATIIMWFFMLLIYLSADKHSIYSLKNEKSINPDELVLKRYYDVVNYDAKKERKKSLIYAMIPAAITVVGFVFNKNIVGIIFAILTIVFLNQHTIGHKMKIKATVQEIELTYPRWLMELALLLQTDNVQVSMYKSYENAPIVLKPALEKFFNEIEENPTSKEPYNNFLKEFDIKGVNATMKMLYSLYNGSGTDKDTQIANILKRNNEMIDLGEKIKMDNSMAIYSLLYMLPTLAMTIKLVTDMFVFMGSLTNTTFQL